MDTVNMAEKNFYQTLNEQLIAAFSSSSKLNYCRFLLPEKDGQVSLVAKYVPCFSVEAYKSIKEFCSEPYITLAVSDVAECGVKVVESQDYEAYYYGISPAIDETVIVDGITDGKFTSKAGLDSFIAERCTGFMLHKNQREYLIPCARLFVLSIAHNFGIKLRVEDPLYEHLLRFSNTTMVEKGTENGEILLCGSPTEELFRELDGYRFQKEDDGLHWKCCAPESDGMSVRDIYKEKENIVLLKGHTFYSGALLRILHIDTDFQSYGNDTIVPLQFLFERSSYGTVYTLDNNYTDHPLLDTCRDVLLEMYRADDRCKRRLLDETAAVVSRKDCIAAVNRYLDHSSNVNQMGVTGNIITADGILLVGERETASIDAGELYPSVNGNAEVVDANVRFYKLSANEDYPTIKLTDSRIDFNGELSREAYAELSIAAKADAWYCYGFTISGNIPEQETGKEYPFHKRRMHFNIVCEQICDLSFEEIVEKQKKSSEAFENHMIKGLQLAYYPNRRSLFWDRFLNSCRVILDNESYVMAVLAVCVFASAVINAFQSGSLTSITFSLSDILSVGFSILAVIVIMDILRKAIKKFHFNREHIKKIHIVGDHNSRHGFRQITKYFEEHSCHPVAYAAVMARVLKISLYK